MLLRKKCLVGGPYRYRAFGLHIASDLLLPELVAAGQTSGDPDVVIRFDKVPCHISATMGTGDIYRYQGKGSEFLLRFQGVGGYYVTNGNSIVVEPYEDSEEQSVRMFLMNFAFYTLLLQRRAITMHGSAVVIDDHCVIFTGDAGAGKSTLAAAFRDRGYPLLTDDVAAIVMDGDGIPWVQAGLPSQKLRTDSAAAIGLDITGCAPAFSSSFDDKFAVPVVTGFHPSPVPLGAIYELRAGDLRDVTISRLSAADKLVVIIDHSWSRLVDRMGFKTDHFKICLDMATRLPVSRLTRPGGMFSLADQMRLVREDLNDL